MPSPPLNPPPAGMSQDVIDFRTRTIMSDVDVDALWMNRSGFLEAVIRGNRAAIYARLRKRYKVPFSPEPEKVVQWIALLTTPAAYRARGYNPSEAELSVVDADAQRAQDEIKEAADSKDGLFDLPVDDAADASAISKGGPVAYAEASPYDWIDVQAEALNGR